MQGEKGFMNPTAPKEFFWRRLHSLTGLFFALFLIQHLLVNSQAALFIGDDGKGFVNAVEAIHNFPYLPVIELVFLGIPICIHMFWGIRYLQTSQQNAYAFNSLGEKPCLPEYPRNKAYTWQRITSWILLAAILLHVLQMRFIEEPLSIKQGAQKYYFVRAYNDPGLASVAARLEVQLIDAAGQQGLEKQPLDRQEGKESLEAMDYQTIFKKRPLKDGQVLLQAKNFGTAELLMVRETFKSPLMIALYTIFVLSACFHGFNGLWTFMIKWGVTMTDRSQKLMLKISTTLMFLIAFLGLAAIWGTYWLNLKQ